jgi:hypothetical protein
VRRFSIMPLLIRLADFSGFLARDPGHSGRGKPELT